MALAPESTTAILRPRIPPSFRGHLRRLFLVQFLKVSGRCVVSWRQPIAPVQAVKSWVKDFLPPNTKVGGQTSVVMAVSSLEMLFLFFVFMLYLVWKGVPSSLSLNNPSSVIFWKRSVHTLWPIMKRKVVNSSNTWVFIIMPNELCLDEIVTVPIVERGNMLSGLKKLSIVRVDCRSTPSPLFIMLDPVLVPIMTPITPVKIKIIVVLESPF